VTAVVASTALFVWDASRDDLIAADVEVAGTSLHGLRAGEARARLERTLVERLTQPVLVRHGDRVFELSPAAVGLRVDVDALPASSSEPSRGG
jgi:hypothetical protein